MIDRFGLVSNRVPRLATAIVLTIALTSTPRSAHAVSAYLTAFEAQYPAAAGSRIDTCNVCHTSPPQLNAYGMAYQGAGHQFAPIENVDSDGDGYTNLAEIMALTFPGDPADTPPPLPTATTTPLPATPTASATPLSATATPTIASTTATVTITSLSATATVTITSVTATPTITEQASDTPTVAPSGSPTNTSAGPPPTITLGSPTRTNTPGGQTITPTTPTASPTNRPGSTPTKAARTATVGPRPNEDDGCSIVATERSSIGGGLAVLLAPALLVWASRRRL